jgi:RNA polymerase sigma-70 factor (ECF subfamily)
MALIRDDVFVEEIGNVKKTAFGVAYLILKNTYDCEDAMSEAIVKAYEHRDKLKKRSSFRAWFLQILRNEAYNVLRERRKVFETDELPEQPQLFPDTEQTLDLHAALMRLPEDRRNALYLQENGYSMEEIAAILDTPVGTVKSRISRAKETLRSYLEVN